MERPLKSNANSETGEKLLASLVPGASMASGEVLCIKVLHFKNLLFSIFLGDAKLANREGVVTVSGLKSYDLVSRRRCRIYFFLTLWYVSASSLRYLFSYSLTHGRICMISRFFLVWMAKHEGFMSDAGSPAVCPQKVKLYKIRILSLSNMY